jgi:hypothetical protein
MKLTERTGELRPGSWPTSHPRQGGILRDDSRACPPAAHKPALFFDQLAPGEHLTVRTRNSEYHIVILEPDTRSIILRGGRLFPHAREARLLGSLGDDRVTGPDRLAVGARFAFAVGSRCFLTSSVVSLEREVPLPTVQADRASYRGSSPPAF